MSETAATPQSDSSVSTQAPIIVAAPAAARYELSANLGLAAVLGIGGALLLLRLHSGWFPHDEGALGQSAERVLLGQVPHRDYDEIYTGLLTYVHALSFKLFGITLPSLRIPLFAATLVWLVAVYRLLIRFTPPIGAALVSLVILIWSVPNYPASLPSWYNLFCATWGLLALIRWTEDGRRRWLLLAGLAGGLSFLFKLTGVFYVAGGAMAIAAVTATSRTMEPRTADAKYAALLVSLGLAAIAAVILFVMLRAGWTEVSRYAMPIVVLAAALGAREWTQTGGSARGRLEDLLKATVPFALGAALPVILFFGWFAAQGALVNMLEGVFLTPFRRVGFAQIPPPPPLLLIWLIPFAWLLWPRRDAADPRWRRNALLLALPLGMLLLLSDTTPAAYLTAWHAAWGLPLLATLIAAAAAIPGCVPFLDRLEDHERSALICAGVIAAFVLLVEYPFAAPIYTLYALPVAAIAVVMATRATRRTPLPMQWGVLLFFALFGMLRVEPTDVAFLGAGYVPRTDAERLDVPRGGLVVRPAHAWEYATVVSLVEQHAARRPVWSGPDSPEVYFLSGTRNHTRTMFDFLDVESGSALRDIERIGAGMVVINMHPGFSPPLGEHDLVRLRATFPHSRSVGRFYVLWR